MKEKDKLKEFIESNRDEFDFETPPSIDFSSITKEQPQKESSKPVKTISLRTIINIAAAITIFLGIGSLIYFQNNSSKQHKNPISEEKNESIDFSFASVSNEMAEVESYYIQQVQNKQQLITEAGFSEDIKEELTLLDEEFNNLKNELGSGADDQLILEEMIQNYQLKLNLLEKVLENINTPENKISKKEENDASYTVYY